MNEEEKRAAILDFERNRQLLANISAQKQQVSLQLEVSNASLAELAKVKDKTVYKIVGNVLFPKEVAEMEKELTERKESLSLRLKTIEKQEENFLKKLNSIKSKLEAELKGEVSKTDSSSDRSEIRIEKKKK